MRLTIVTDAWHPQINGVVRTLDQTIAILRKRGHEITVLHPGQFRTVGLPGYGEIRVAWDVWRLGAAIEQSRPDALHIAVEGSLGVTAKLWADRRGWRYTTSYHTRFPEYVQARYGVGLRAGYAFMRWFHAKSQAVMVNTPSMTEHLTAKGFARLAAWGRGVDTEQFTPDGPIEATLVGLPRPVLLNVGRVAVEKNLSALYSLPTTGSIVQVGDGPMLDGYRQAFPHVHFLGSRSGAALAACYRAADVFVFPSESDTFGLVMLEALASGVPVAAFPVTGPADIVRQEIDGALDLVLGNAVFRALHPRLRDRQAIREAALRFSWDACTDQFEDNLVPL